LIGSERIIERTAVVASTIEAARDRHDRGALASHMCDYFLQMMEGDQAGGDLTDVVRAGGVVPGNAEVPSSSAAEWYHHGEAPSSLLFPPPPSSSDGGCGLGSAGGDVFGDPFSGLGDPFSTDYSSGADLLDAMPDAMAKVGFHTAVGNGSGGFGGGGGGQLLDLGRKPLLPRGVQMSAVGLVGPPVLSPPRAIRPYPLMGSDMVKLGITAGQMAGCAIDAAVVGMQMSSPRAASGIKRRLDRSDDCFLAYCFCMYTRYTACDC
jgi:hypothetical protein